MKRLKKFNPIILILVVLSVSAFIGKFLDVLGVLGFLTFMFFGVGGAVASVIGRQRKPKELILFLFSLISLWVGYELMAAGFYNPVLSKPLMVEEWVSNHPDPNAVGTLMIAFGLIGLMALIKDRNFRKNTRALYTLIVIMFSIFIFGGLSIFYSNLVGEEIIIEGTISIKNKGLPEFLSGGFYLGGFFASPKYYIMVDTGKEQKLKFYTDKYIFKTLQEGSLVRVVYKSNAKDVRKIMLLKSQKISN